MAAKIVNERCVGFGWILLPQSISENRGDRVCDELLHLQPCSSMNKPVAVRCMLLEAKCKDTEAKARWSKQQSYGVATAARANARAEVRCSELSAAVEWTEYSLCSDRDAALSSARHSPASSAAAATAALCSSESPRGCATTTLTSSPSHLVAPDCRRSLKMREATDYNAGVKTP